MTGNKIESFHKREPIAEITICGSLHITIEDENTFIVPTPEQRKNLKELLCIDVKVFNEELDDSDAYKYSICTSAEKYADGTCTGYGKSEIDDEPIEVCKVCDKYIGYESNE